MNGIPMDQYIAVLIIVLTLLAIIGSAVFFVLKLVRGPGTVKRSKWKPDIPWNKLNSDQGQRNGLDGSGYGP